ncbi:MAG: VOC family protein [Ilumatobacteraceae bacterium]
MLDSPDPIALARFYERLLGWPIVAREGPRPGGPPEDGWAKLRSPTEDMKIEIQWEPHHVPPTWPPVEGQQLMMMHLDIEVDDLDAGLELALDAGAVIAEHQPHEGMWVLLDPDGHPFCLFEAPP